MHGSILDAGGMRVNRWMKSPPKWSLVPLGGLKFCVEKENPVAKFSLEGDLKMLFLRAQTQFQLSLILIPQ